MQKKCETEYASFIHNCEIILHYIQDNPMIYKENLHLSHLTQII